MGGSSDESLHEGSGHPYQCIVEMAQVAHHPNLDEMTAKQRKKELKSAAKEIRSKDASVRGAAIDKVFADPRYMSEGECIIPLLETISTAKKSHEETKDRLLKFITHFKTHGSTTVDATPSDAIIRTIKAATGGMSILLVIVNLLVFRLEMKIKKKENNDANFGFSEIECTLRSLALQTLYLLSTTLSESYSDELIEMASLSNFVGTLDQALCMYASRLTDTALSPTQIQECLWMLSLLHMILSKSLMPQRISAEAFGYILQLNREDSLSSQCVNLIQVLSHESRCADMVFTSTVLMALISSLEHATPKLIVDTEVTPITPVKGKAPPKKPDKRTSLIPDKVIDSADARMTYLLIARMLLDLFPLFASRSPELFDECAVTKVVTQVSRLLSATTVWELVRSPRPDSPDSNPADLLLAGALFLSTLAKVGHAERQLACKSGGASALLLLLTQSSAAVGMKTAITEELISARQWNLLVLRSCCEKALLDLLTSSIVDSDQESYWTSCSHYSTDIETLQSFDAQTLLDSALLDDIDLGNRCLRILAALLQCSHDKCFVADSLTNSVAKLATMLHSRTSLIVVPKKTEPNVKASAAVIRVPVAHSSTTASEVNLVHAEAGSSVADEPATVRTLHTSPLFVKEAFGENLETYVPTTLEVIALLLLTIEPYIAATSDHVLSFDITGQYANLANLVYVLGPTCIQSTPTLIQESVVIIRDLRSPYLPSTVLIRRFIFKVLRYVAAADRSYRTFTSEVPPPALTPLPDSSSCCQAAAIAVCNDCADACVATLLCESSVNLVLGNLVVVRSYTRVLLDESVLNEALNLWLAMADCGLLGLSTCMQGLVSAEWNAGVFPDVSTCSAVKSVRDFVCANVLSSIPHLPREFDPKDKAGKQQLIRPITPLFDKMFPTNASLPTAVATLSDNPELWACIAQVVSIIGILSNPRQSESSCTIAIQCLWKMCYFNDYHEFIQPFLADTYSALVLCLGGGVSLASNIGRFGTLSTSTSGEELLKYICSRGFEREAYWAAYAASLDPKAKKKVHAKGKPDPFLGYMLPFEPDSSHPDPNHGPDSTLWNSLLCVSSYDRFFAACSPQTLLSTCIVHDLDMIASIIISKKDSVNIKDTKGISSLMYALLFKKSTIVDLLLENGADFNARDSAGNPTFKYIFLSLQDTPKVVRSNAGDIQLIWQPKYYSAESESDSNALFELVSTFISKGVDLEVSDENGNFPLHYACGAVNQCIEVSESLYFIRDFVHNCDEKSLVQLLKQLIDVGGADVIAANKQGIVPLHILSALADVPSIEYLIRLGATPNPIDSNGYTPLHYLCGSARRNATKCLDLLLTHGANNPVEKVSFDGSVNELSKSEKEKLKLNKFVDDCFANSMCPASITKARLTLQELCSLETDSGLTPLHLMLAGARILNEPFTLFAQENRVIRLRLVDTFHVNCKSTLSHLYSSVDKHGTSILHCASLLFREPMDTDFYPKRPKVKSKKAPSMEHEILGFCMAFLHGKSSDVCTRAMSLLQPLDEWSCLHGAISMQNIELIEYILTIDHSFPSDCLHYAASSHLSSSGLKHLIEAIGSSSDYNVHFNKPGKSFSSSPIHIAIQHENVLFIEAAATNLKFDVNIRVDGSDGTPCHEICRRGSLAALTALSTAADRLDFLLTDCNGLTCLELAISAENVSIVKLLIDMRRNDCIEILTRTNADGSTLLCELEKLSYPTHVDSSVERKDVEVDPASDLDKNDVSDLDLDGSDDHPARVLTRKEDSYLADKNVSEIAAGVNSMNLERSELLTLLVELVESENRIAFKHFVL